MGDDFFVCKTVSVRSTITEVETVHHGRHYSYCLNLSDDQLPVVISTYRHEPSFVYYCYRIASYVSLYQTKDEIPSKLKISRDEYAGEAVQEKISRTYDVSLSGHYHLKCYETGRYKKTIQ